MDVFNMTYVKNTTVHKLKKKRKNHPVYEDKSGSRRKVIAIICITSEHSNFKI